MTSLSFTASLAVKGDDDMSLSISQMRRDIKIRSPRAYTAANYCVDKNLWVCLFVCVCVWECARALVCYYPLFWEGLKTLIYDINYSLAEA